MSLHVRSSFLKVQVVGCLVYPVGRARASLCSDSLHCASVCEPCFVLFFSRHFFLTCECFCCLVLCACMCVCVRAHFQSSLPFSSVALQKHGFCVESLVRSPLTRRHSHRPFYEIAVRVGVRARAPLMREVCFETACFAVNGLC